MKHSASIAFILVAFSSEAISQNAVTYGYDASGNRISRICMAAASKTSRRNVRKTSVDKRRKNRVAMLTTY